MLERSRSGSIAILRMQRPPANALDTELVQAVRDGLSGAIDDDASAIVITGSQGFFSAGLDVPVLIELDRQGIRGFWESFFGLMRDLAASPVPVAAAVTGHSPAGGAVIALHCDYRIAATGDFRFGFNEVQVGLPVPPTILESLTELVGFREARQLAIRGTLVPMDEALSLGLVDELEAPEKVEARAIGWCRELAELPAAAMNSTRRALKSRLLASLESTDDIDMATNAWFSDETQAALRSLVARLGGS